MLRMFRRYDEEEEEETLGLEEEGEEEEGGDCAGFVTDYNEVYRDVSCVDEKAGGRINLDYVYPCFPLQLPKIISILVNEVDNTLGGHMSNLKISRMERRGAFEVFLLSQRGCGNPSVRYTVFPSISSVLVEYKRRAWLVQFLCTDSMSLRRQVEQLRIDPGTRVAKNIALIPLPADIVKISKNIITVVSDYPVGHTDGHPLAGLLQGELSIAEKYWTKIFIGATVVKKKVYIDSYGVPRLPVRLVGVHGNYDSARRVILSFLGISASMESLRDIVISKSILDYISAGFSGRVHRAENRIECLYNMSRK